MLIEFRVENHRSLRDEHALTMTSEALGDTDDARPRVVAGTRDKLLPVAAIYGANASGKTNMVAALAYMAQAVRDSHRRWSPIDGVPRDPFAWGKHRQHPSLYEVTFVLEGVRYQYGFVVDDEAVVEEWLHAWPKEHKQRWFERDRQRFRFGDKFEGNNKTIEKSTRPNALFLSTAVQFNHALCRDAFQWFDGLRTHNLPVGRRASRPFESFVLDLALRLQDVTTDSEDPTDLALRRLSDQFVELMRRADLGIHKIRIKLDEQANGNPLMTNYELQHRPNDDSSWLPLEEESRGTKSMFALGLLSLHVLLQGNTLLVDELEASLHPALARVLIEQFQDPEINPRGAQLIFTTHDSQLIGNTVGPPVLRRDQIWFTEKDAEGATKLYPLTDYQPRKAENLERGYLQGRYGAIPFLGDLTLAAKD